MTQNTEMPINDDELMKDENKVGSHVENSDSSDGER